SRRKYPLEPVRDDRGTLRREDTLWMELNPFNRKMDVAKAHHHTVVRLSGNLQLRRNRLAVYHQRVIARGRKGARDVAEDAATVVLDTTGLSVHEGRRVRDARSIYFTDRLISQTHTQDRRIRP